MSNQQQTESGVPRAGEQPHQRITITVSADQVDAARTLIRLRGGEHLVDPVIVCFAHAESRRHQSV